MKIPEISQAAKEAIMRGIERGDAVADLEMLGLEYRIVCLLEDSKLNIITIEELMSATKQDLLKYVSSFAEATLAKLFACLARYDEIEGIRKSYEDATATRKNYYSVMK